jgi:CheY-like chemotaxis protein
VVAAQDEREQILADGAHDKVGDALAGLLDLRQETHALVTDRARLGDRGRDVSPVLAAASEALNARVESRVADRRGPHVDASTPRSEIERSADDRDPPVTLHGHRGKASLELMTEALREAADRGIRVLIADDDRRFRDSLRDLIDRQPELSVVGSAADGLEALELAEELDPDAVVLDLHMPLLDGVTAAARLRRDHPHVCLIALTGDDAPALHAAVREAGADEVLLKNQLVGVLIERIGAVRVRS